MPDFSFEASDNRGQLVRGVETAADVASAQRALRRRGLTPVSIVDGAAASGDAGRSSGLFQRASGVPRQQVLRFTSELSVLLKAGLPVDRALKVQIDTAPDGPFKLLLQDLLDRLKGGRAISAALEHHPDVFDSFYVSMVRSGEASGLVSQVLAELAAYLERSRAVRSSVVSALIYPAILAVVAVISIIIMLGFVVPEFESLFEEMGDGLPALTALIVALGDFVESWGLLLVPGLVGGWLLLKRYLATDAGQQWRDRRLLKTPIARGIVTKFEIARFARTMGTLLANGVSVLRAASIAEGTVGNSVLRQSFAQLSPALKQGGRLASAMDRDVFSPMAIQMVSVGEESGSLDAMLVQLAEVYESEVEAEVKRALTLLEPALILGMGGIIAVIIMGILMGILSVNTLVV